jgi:prolyl 4-hydroxylase
VEEGGETNFPDLGIKVKPEKGSAVLWPSVRNDALTTIEPSTRHAALPVIKGHKFAANSW